MHEAEAQLAVLGSEGHLHSLHTPFNVTRLCTNAAHTCPIPLQEAEEQLAVLEAGGDVEGGGLVVQRLEHAEQVRAVRRSMCACMWCGRWARAVQRRMPQATAAPSCV